MIIYLHGWNSNSASSKAQQMLACCRARDIRCVAPDLPDRPAAAMELARSQCAPADKVVAVGSSLGGSYATALVEEGHAAAGVLINPAVRVAEKLTPFVGTEQENYNTGVRYTFTAAHVRELEAITVTRIADPSRYLLLVQQGDELLDHREAVDFYAGATQVVEEGGDHSFTGFERHLDAIVALLDR